MYDVARLLRSIAVISAITASNPWTSVKPTTSCTRVQSYISYIVYFLSIAVGRPSQIFFSPSRMWTGFARSQLFVPSSVPAMFLGQQTSPSCALRPSVLILLFWYCCFNGQCSCTYRTQLLSCNLWFNSWWRLLHEVVEPTNRWHDQLHPTTLWRQATTETTSCVLYVTNDPLWFETRSLHGRQRWTAFLQHVKYCKYAERSSGYFCVELDLWVCSYSSMLKVLRLRFVLCGDEES